MKELTMYVCEKCGCKWDTEDEATTCESSHIEVSKIKPVYKPLEPIPFEVSLVFENETEVQYKA